MESRKYVNVNVYSTGSLATNSLSVWSYSVVDLRSLLFVRQSNKIFIWKLASHLEISFVNSLLYKHLIFVLYSHSDRQNYKFAAIFQPHVSLYQLSLDVSSSSSM